MASQVQSKSSSAGIGPNPLSLPGSSIGEGQGRVVEVLHRQNFEQYKRALQGRLESSFSEKAQQIKKGILYATAAAVCVVATIAILCYLNVVIPATFVWPGLSKLGVAVGIAALGLGGLSLTALASESFQKGFDSSTLSNLVEIESRSVIFN